MAAKACSWVTMGPAPHFATCQRCGRHEQAPEMPLPVAAFTAYLRYLMAKHRDCQESERAT